MAGITFFSIPNDYDDLFDQQEADASAEGLYSAQCEISKLITQVQVLNTSNASKQKDLEMALLADQFVQELNRKDLETRDREIQKLSSQVQELKSTKASDASTLGVKVDQLIQKVEQLQGETSKASSLSQEKLLQENRSLAERLAAAEAKNKELERHLLEAEQQAKAIAQRLAAQERKAQEQLAADKAKSSLVIQTADALLATVLKY